MSKQSDFVLKYYKDALESEKQTGVPALFTLAQAAHESGYGKHAPGYNFFGIKAGKKWTGKKQLLQTSEILNTSTYKGFPVIISVTPTSTGKYKYKIKDYFRAYDTPKDSFIDHGKFFLENSRYRDALKTKDSKAFATAIAKAGYATDPSYAQLLHSMIDKFQSSAKELFAELKKNVAVHKKSYIGAFLLLLTGTAAYAYRKEIFKQYKALSA